MWPFILSYQKENKLILIGEWWVWEVKRINTTRVCKILVQASITAGPSRSIGLKTAESSCTSNHLRISNAGNHCLISAKDLSCCGDDVLNMLMAQPGWWLSKAAWNKWLSLQATLYCSPYLSSLEMRAHEETIPVTRLALQVSSYRCKERVRKIWELWAAGWEIRSRQKPSSQGSAILRAAFEKPPSTATLLFSTFIALLCEALSTVWLK